MKFLGILFVFFGYVFVYAAAAAGGRFATEPLAGLFADAYTDATDAQLNQQLAQVVADPNAYPPLTPAPAPTPTQQQQTAPSHGGTF